MPVLSHKKYVILNDYNFEKCSKSDFERLCEIIKNVDPTVFLYLDLILSKSTQKKARGSKK